MKTVIASKNIFLAPIRAPCILSRTVGAYKYCVLLISQCALAKGILYVSQCTLGKLPSVDWLSYLVSRFLISQ